MPPPGGHKSGIGPYGVLPPGGNTGPYALRVVGTGATAPTTYTQAPGDAMLYSAGVLVKSISCLPYDSPTTSLTTVLVCLGKLSFRSCLKDS
jgi:hypothetical protein